METCIMGIEVSKKFPHHLMEKSGLLRYASETGVTVITITYDAGTKDGWMTVIKSESNNVSNMQRSNDDHD